MCQEEAQLIATFMFAMSLAVGTMGLVFFRTWRNDRKKEGALKIE